MNNDYPHPIIAREGWTFLAIAIVVAALFTGWGWGFLAFLAWLAVAFIAQFFRDPARVVPQQPNAVLSPADGRIVKVEKTRDPFLDRDALKISVFMNVFNVHCEPQPGRWRGEEPLVPRRQLPQRGAWTRPRVENERNALHLRTASGQDVTCVQIAGLIARRILCYVEPGATLKRGQRYGFIRFGSRVDVYLDPAAKPRVAVGDVVAATSTILAEFP